MNRLCTHWPCAAALLLALLLAPLLALVAALPVAAQTEPAALAVTGSLRGSAWSGSRDLDDRGGLAQASAWLRSDLRLGEGLNLVADARLLARTPLGSSQPNAQQARLRELALRWRAGPAELRLGRQIIAWGRADAINPTDSFGKRDYSLLAAADTDQREGADAVSLRWTLDEAFSLQAVWLPHFRSDTIPLADAPMQSVTNVPSRSRRNGGLKLEHQGGDVDWSLSVYDGLDRMPDLGIAGSGPSGLQLALANHPVRVFGADFSTTVGQTVLRGEIGWAKRRQTGTAEDFFRKRSQWLAVLGGDHSFDGGLNLNLQLFAQRVRGWRSAGALADPVAQAVAQVQQAINNQGQRQQLGLSWRLAKSWGNDAWLAELSGVHSLTTHGQVLRGQLRQQIDDHWQWSLGFEHFRGPAHTVFGQLRRNATAHAELRYQF